MSDVLLIFSRFPRLGKVKTRLTPALSPRQALQLHTAFLLDTLERTSVVKARRRLLLADCDLAEARRWAKGEAAAAGVGLHLQSGADLGQRMWNAYHEAARENDRAVLIGTDSPTLPVSHINDAFEALRSEAVAIAPADDGGYCLLGLARPLRRIFDGIDWGGDQVFSQTLQRLEGVGHRILPKWRDVDTPEDLLLLSRELRDPTPGEPRRTARLLRSMSI